MEYCQNHPDRAATHYCHTCYEYSCDTCSNERNDWESRCFTCQNELEDLGSGFSAEPFWRRLDKMFRYALDTEVLIYISILAILTPILSVIVPIGLVILLLMTGAFIKYCFTCLEQTSMGKMKPPRVAEGYQGGLVAIFRLMLVFVGIGAMCILAITLLGKNIGALVSVFLVAALPAAVITLAVQNSVLMAINPVNLWRIISAVGLPYGVLLAFLMIMSSSVAILQSLLTNNFSFFGTMLQSFISNYYTVVMFHLMGYMIFQYQRNLGFTVRSSDNKKKIRTELEKTKAKLSILMRQGKFDDIIPAYKKALKEHPNDLVLAKQYFDYLNNTKNTNEMASYSQDYLSLLYRNNRSFDLPSVYKHVRHFVPSFLPDSPDIRLAIAQQLYDTGDHRNCIPLLQNMHKSFPDFQDLPTAYRLLASIADNTNQLDVAKKLRAFSENFESQQSQQEHKKQTALESALVSKSVQQSNEPVSRKQTIHEASTDANENDHPPSGGLSLVPMDQH